MYDFHKVSITVVLCFFAMFVFFVKGQAAGHTIIHKNCETPEQVQAYVMAKARLNSTRVKGWWLKQKAITRFLKAYNETAVRKIPTSLDRIGYFTRSDAPTSVFFIAFRKGCKAAAWQMEKRDLKILFEGLKKQTGLQVRQKFYPITRA